MVHQEHLAHQELLVLMVQCLEVVVRVVQMVQLVLRVQMVHPERLVQTHRDFLPVHQELLE